MANEEESKRKLQILRKKKLINNRKQIKGWVDKHSWINTAFFNEIHLMTPCAPLKFPGYFISLLAMLLLFSTLFESLRAG